MVRPRTWDVSVDGWDHVVTYTPRRSDTEMSVFAIDGKPITLEWRQAKSGADAQFAHAEIRLNDHRLGFHWKFARHSEAGTIALALTRLFGAAFQGQVSNDPYATDRERFEGLWVSVDDVTIPERPDPDEISPTRPRRRRPFRFRRRPIP
jgi:hypothetical protein